MTATQREQAAFIAWANADSRWEAAKWIASTQQEVNTAYEAERAAWSALLAERHHTQEDTR